MARILLLADDQHDRRLLYDQLAGCHTIIPGEGGDTADVDLCIVDAAALARVESWLARRRREAAPLVLPVLLVIDRAGVRDADAALRRVVDELITTPVEPVELRARTEALLRLRTLSREATAADRVKTELLHTVMHELRTPLGAIKGYASNMLLFGEQLESDERQSFLQEIDSAADRLGELVNNLLDLARLESGALPIDPGPASLTDVLAAAVEEARHRHPDRTITLTIAAGLPLLRADARRLRQVAANLLENALKFSPDGTPVRVRAEPAPDPDAVRFMVEDQGIGIAPEHQERIFDRFYRVQDPRADEAGGTGLGLAICRRIVEQHGGSITLRSDPGAGAVFTVTLPLTRVMNAER